MASAEGRYVVWVTGGRAYANGARVREALAAFPPGTVVLHGQAAGADTLGDQAAAALGHFRVRVPYHDALGRRGGPARNALIGRIVAALAAADGLTAICCAFGGDAGTDGSVVIAKRHGFEVREYDRPAGHDRPGRGAHQAGLLDLAPPGLHPSC